MSIKVYRFGLLPPTEQAKRVREQMFLAHRYRNTLTEIERGRRAALRLAMSAYDDVRALEASVADASRREEFATKAVKSAKARPPGETKRSTLLCADHDSKHSADMLAAARDVLKKAREERKAATRALRERRAALREDAALVAETDRINELAAELGRSARAHCNVYWGTYLLIEDAAQSARKAPLYDGAEPNDPRFSRWEDEGAVGVQIQKGMLVSEALGGEDTRLRVRTGIPAVNKRTGMPLIGRRAGQRSELRMRIGSDGRDPVWAMWPMIMHRPMPEAGTIKKVTVSLRRIGPREEWSVEFTVAMDDVSRSSNLGTGAVAIDVGWRQMGSFNEMTDSIRVGSWLGEDGHRGEVRIPSGLISAIRKAEDLRSIRDKSFDAALAALVTWLRTQEMPEWMRMLTVHRGEQVPSQAQAISYLSGWKSQARLATFAQRWRSARFDGDADGYTALEAWRYHDYHLWAWECSQRTKALRHRREVYRCFAAMLANKYSTLVLEDMDLRTFAVRPTADAEKHENETARSNRQLAAVSELRLVLANAFRSRGGIVEQVPAHDTTRRCHVDGCGLVEAFDAASNLRHACANGHEWDQDENAAVNLLDRWRERSADAAKPDSARDDKNETSLEPVAESRWVKAKRLRREKEARMGGAREAIANNAE